jgi:S-adenosylmethionine hydrolase
MPAAPPDPIITLTSDFGTRDSYVAQMKAVLLRHCPRARLIDITHEIAPQDIVAGSITLERAVYAFPPGTIHLAVIDPGVGGERKLLISNIARQTVVCPDNGLITWASRRLGPAQTFELTWRPASSSNTFHGRDIMAPAAGKIAAGMRLRNLSRPLAGPVLLNLDLSTTGVGQVIHIDHFGNATTNLPGPLTGASTVHVRGKRLGALRRTYSEVLRGKPLALVGSSGLIEVAVREGSAAEKLKLKIGDEVRLVRAT